MQFTSFYFLCFAPAVILLYYAVKDTWKNAYLLLVSLVFYSTFGLPSFIVLCAMILVTYGFARILANSKSKPVFLAGVILLTVLLSSIRFMDRTNNAWFGMTMPFTLFVPIGFSFFTLNAIGYLSDLYTGKLEEPLSLIETGVFLSFFPVVTSGPILRAGAFAQELRRPKESLSYERIRKAFLWVLWGYFMKLAVAERCALVTGTVYGDESFHGLPVILAMILYSIQIYADFAGYSLIAKGLAYGMGITVPDNFRQPYLSSSVKEFWRRWHISLSTWLKDYVYIPLGGSRKGKFNTYRNLMITFLVSGFWHGTGLTFLVWGALHGIFQILEGLIFKQKSEEMQFSTRLFRTALTFALVSVAWVFFRSYGVREALGILFRTVRPGQAGILFTERLYTMGMDARNLRIFVIAMILLVCADVRQYRHGDLMERFLSRHIVLRILIVWVILFFVILSVNLSGTEFIYMQF